MIERFAVPDQLTYYYDRPAEPANVHVEVLVSGGLNERVVRESVQTAAAAEPGLRARRAQPADLLAEVARQTRHTKEHQGPQVDLASRMLRALFAAEDAAEFAARYAKALDQLTESQAGRR